MIDWNEMSDQELNDALAEELFGYQERVKVRPRGHVDAWRVAFKSGGEGIGDYACYYDEGGTKIYCGQPHRIFFAPRFSSTWDGMAKVIDALRARGLYVGILTCTDYFEVVITTNGHAMVYACSDKSAPRAVAIAAIEAVRWLSRVGDHGDE